MDYDDVDPVLEVSKVGHNEQHAPGQGLVSVRISCSRSFSCTGPVASSSPARAVHGTCREFCGGTMKQ